MTALHLSCASRDHRAVGILLRYGADPNVRATNGSTPLHYACYEACHKSITKLLDYRVDINCQDNDGNTPLHLLVGRSDRVPVHTQCLRALLERNVDFEIKNFNGETPLLCAVRTHVNYRGCFIADVVELLLTIGADVNVQCIVVGVIGDTPIHVAVRNNHERLVKIILNHNPDLRICNENKQTALDLAKELDRSDIIKCIEEQLHPIRCRM